jgi:hypothetical protein
VIASAKAPAGVAPPPRLSNLVQDHRVRGNQLFTLEAVDHEVRRLGEIEVSELGPDRIEPLHCADIVVLVVAHQDLLGNPFDALRIEGQRLGLVGHGLGSGLGKRRLLDQGRRRGGACKNAHALNEISSLNFICHFRLL